MTAKFRFCTSPAPITTKFTESVNLSDKRTLNLSFLCHDFAKRLPLKEKSKIGQPENVTGNDPRSRLGQTHTRPLFRSNHIIPKVVGNAYFLPDKHVQSTFCRCNLLLSRPPLKTTGLGQPRQVTLSKRTLREGRPTKPSVNATERECSTNARRNVYSCLPLRFWRKKSASFVLVLAKTVFRTIFQPLEHARRRSRPVRTWPVATMTCEFKCKR